MPKLLDLHGQTFGRLTVLHRDAHRANWIVVCRCGTRKSVRGAHLVRGATTSCGCLHREVTSAAHKKHGKSNSRTHNIWMKMRARCNRPTDPAYADYGGRGIRVCERWASFEAFLSDMGEAPAGVSIDRIDNDGDYKPGNCRWATAKEQARNRRSNVKVTVGGQTMHLYDAANLAAVKPKTFIARVKAGWDVDKAFSTPHRAYWLTK